MPAGFPVKFGQSVYIILIGAHLLIVVFSGWLVAIEIPLFHLMSARVTFGNINGVNQSVPHVSLQEEEVPIVHSQPAQVTMDMHTRVMQLVNTIMYR